MENSLDWNEGPPPFAGWWNASELGLDPGEWRWWDGTQWSLGASGGLNHLPPVVVNGMAAVVSPVQETVLWTWYWPEGARVPRQYPEGWPYDQVAEAMGLSEVGHAIDRISGATPNLVAIHAQIAAEQDAARTSPAIEDDDDIDFS